MRKQEVSSYSEAIYFLHKKSYWLTSCTMSHLEPEVGFNSSYGVLEILLQRPELLVEGCIDGIPIRVNGILQSTKSI